MTVAAPVGEAGAAIAIDEVSVVQETNTYPLAGVELIDSGVPADAHEEDPEAGAVVPPPCGREDIVTEYCFENETAVGV